MERKEEKEPGRASTNSAVEYTGPMFYHRSSYEDRLPVYQVGNNLWYLDFYCEYCNINMLNMSPANIDSHLASRACNEARHHPCERVGCPRRYARNHCRFCNGFWTCSKECWRTSGHLQRCTAAQTTSLPDPPVLDTPVVAPAPHIGTLCTFSQYAFFPHYCGQCKNGVSCDMCMPCDEDECEHMTMRNRHAFGYPTLLVNHCVLGHPDRE